MGKFFYRRSFWVLAGILCASAVLMVACPEKKNNDGAGMPYCQPGQYCPNNGNMYGPGFVQPGGYALASAVGSLDYNGSYLALTFSALNGQMPMGGIGGVSNYSGPVIATGEIYFGVGSACPGVFPGQRMPIVSTIQPGNWSNGSFGGLILQVANGMQVKLPNNFLMTEHGSNPPIRIKNPVFMSTFGGPDCVFTSL